MNYVRDADKLGQKAIKAFAQDMFKHLGMRVWVMSAHVNQKEHVCVSK
jgi:hypothetical protein